MPAGWPTRWRSVSARPTAASARSNVPSWPRRARPCSWMRLPPRPRCSRPRRWRRPRWRRRCRKPRFSETPEPRARPTKLAATRLPRFRTLRRIRMCRPAAPRRTHRPSTSRSCVLPSPTGPSSCCPNRCRHWPSSRCRCGWSTRSVNSTATRWTRATSAIFWPRWAWASPRSIWNRPGASCWAACSARSWARACWAGSAARP